MDGEGNGLDQAVDAFFAEAKARREATREPEGVTGYEEGDPRLELSELQFLALRPAAEGKGVKEIAAELRCPPERVKRFFPQLEIPSSLDQGARGIRRTPAS